MMDYEYLFAMTLHQKLRERVYGKIFCEINRSNVLVVEIKSRGDWIFNMEFDNFSERFINGFTTEYAMYEVINKYKKFITNRYFVREA